MNRQRASNEVERHVHSLRVDARPLSDSKAAQAREIAALWLEQDARRCLLRDAPPEAAEAVAREYRATGFFVSAYQVFDNGYRLPEVANV